MYAGEAFGAEGGLYCPRSKSLTRKCLVAHCNAVVKSLEPDGMNAGDLKYKI